MDGQELVTVKQLIQRFPALAGSKGGEGGVRWLLFNRQENGLEASGAIVPVGRKLLIDVPRFVGWLRSGAPAQSSKA